MIRAAAKKYGSGCAAGRREPEQSAIRKARTPGPSMTGLPFGRHAEGEQRLGWFRLLAVLVCLLAALCGGCSTPFEGGSMTSSAFSRMEEGMYQEAYDLFQNALEAEEDALPALRGLGIVCMARADYSEAVGYLKEALTYTDEKMPETIRDIRLYLVTAQYRAGEYEDAIQTGRELEAEKS